MRDLIKEKYEKRAVVYNDIWMYFITTSKEIALECKDAGIRICSIDAFKLTGEGIQPSQMNSIDISSLNENSWNVAPAFLSNISDKSYLYEIWYDGY